MIEAHGWSTHVVVMADGVGWKGANYGTGPWNQGRLTAEGATYSVNICSLRVLARCP